MNPATDENEHPLQHALEHARTLEIQASDARVRYRQENGDSRWLSYRAMLQGKSWQECAMISGRVAQLMQGMCLDCPSPIPHLPPD